MDLILPVTSTVLAAIATVATLIGVGFALRDRRGKGPPRRQQPDGRPQEAGTPPSAPAAEQPGSPPPARSFRELGPVSQALVVAASTFILGAAGLVSSQPRLALGLIVVAAVLAGYLALPRGRVPAGWVLLSVAAVMAGALLI